MSPKMRRWLYPSTTTVMLLTFCASAALYAYWEEHWLYNGAGRPTFGPLIPPKISPVAERFVKVRVKMGDLIGNRSLTEAEITDLTRREQEVYRCFWGDPKKYDSDARWDDERGQSQLAQLEDAVDTIEQKLEMEASVTTAAAIIVGK